MEARERRYRLPRPIAAFAEAAQESPALLPCLAAVVTFLLLAAADAGYYPTAWYPAALFVLALLVVTTITVGFPRRLPWPALTALVLFAAYTAWTYLSITWAGQQGDAWEGANRTALYLLVFALFALWPMSETGGRIVLGLFGLGVAGIGLVEALRVDAAANPAAFFVDARFLEPAGYINSNVALWMLGALACLFSAAARESLVLLRPLFLAGAGLLAALALMGQSRGWALALPVALVLFVLVTPGRVRLLAAIAFVGVGVFLAREPLVAVHDDAGIGTLAGRVDDAAGALLLLAGALALIGLIWGLVDRRVELSEGVERGLRWGLALATGLAVVVLLVAAAAGDPEDRLRTSWNDFKAGGGVQESQSRFGSAGTNRYDFWQTAWELFEEEPLRGIGVENFQVEYLKRGTSTELPRFPHSFQLGVLSQTGLVGILLLGGALAAAVLGALMARGPPRPAGGGGGLGRRRHLLVPARLGRLVLGVPRPDRARVRAAGDGDGDGAPGRAGRTAGAGPSPEATRSSAGRPRRPGVGPHPRGALARRAAGGSCRRRVAREPGGRLRSARLGRAPQPPLHRCAADRGDDSPGPW